MPKVPSVSQSQSADPQPGTQETPAPAKPGLAQIQADIKKLHDDLTAEYGNTPALNFVRQKLKEAYSGLEQEMRNITIDAQLVAVEARRKAGQILGR